jgi:predicted esterase
METKERCRTHDLALAPDGTCVLCRRASGAPRAERESSRPPCSAGKSWLFRATLIVALLLIAIIGAKVTWRGAHLVPKAALGTSESSEPTTESETEQATRADGSIQAEDPALEGTLSTKNRSDRSGSFFIPEGSGLPLLVALHGSGGNGAGILAAFKSFAVRRKFAIVAPDCGFIPEAGTYTWYVARERGDESLDSPHIDRSIDEVLRRAEGRIAPSGWLAVGHSGGASSAPYLATHDARFAAFGVLHGGAFPAAFGPMRPRAWFSTGRADPARPPAHVAEQAEQARRILGTSLVELHLFDGGHGLLAGELEGVIRFWLGEAPRVGVAPSER